MKTLASLLAAAALLTYAAPALACEGEKTHTADKKADQKTATVATKDSAAPAQKTAAAPQKPATDTKAPKAATN